MEETLKGILSYANIHAMFENKTYYICNECGKKSIPININPKNIISKVGIEMEGMYRSIRTNTRWVWHTDQSVHKTVCNSCIKQRNARCICEETGDKPNCVRHHPPKCTCDFRLMGEYIMYPPMPYSKFNQFLTEVIKSYPDQVNATCGGHTHYSFESFLYYCLTMDISFVRGLIKMIIDFANNDATDEEDITTILNRVHGGVSYSRAEFNPISQIDGSGDRYTHVNYPYSKHKTIEIRVLPMMQEKNDMSLLLEKTTDYVDSYVRNVLNSMSAKKTRTVYTYNPEFAGKIKREDVMTYYMTQKPLIEAQ